MTPWLVVLATLIAVLTPSARLMRTLEVVDPKIRMDIARLNARLVIGAIATSPLASLSAMVIVLAGLLVRMSAETVGQRVGAIAGTYPLRA